MATNIANYNDRTIFDFRTRLVGGGSRANLFECEIAFPSFLNVGNEAQEQLDVRFLIKAAQLPGSNLNTIPVPFRGRTLKIAGDRTFDPWTITVINDTNFRLRNLFERWSNYINRHDDNSGTITPSTYQSQILVHQLSRGVENLTAPATTEAMKVLKTYKLYGCYPSSIDPIPLSYDTTDTIEEFNVTFEVQWWDAYDGNSNGILEGVGAFAPPGSPQEAAILDGLGRGGGA